jgi:hypothetical protein
MQTLPFQELLLLTNLTGNWYPASFLSWRDAILEKNYSSIHIFIAELFLERYVDKRHNE